ncbi:MAG TPA: isochorismatase family protein [Terriglobia bacterium]|nr:isochorismatase family protein [Terriglobia bacterium]
MFSDPNGRVRLLDRKTVALVSIDLQYKLLSTIFEPERVLRNARLLLRLAEVLNVPSILTTQYANGLGRIQPEISNAAPDIIPFDKTSFSCFGEPKFLAHLRERAPYATTLLLCGIESHICVMQTALGAIANGYLVHVAADAVSSRTPANWQAGLERMERAGAIVSSTETMVYELLGRAGTPEFEAMLPMLK